MTDKSVLMCSYYFPPFARSGGMRSMQFGKRLAELGWDVTILAADPALYSSSVDPSSTAAGYESLPWANVHRIGLPADQAHEGAGKAGRFLSMLRDPWLLEGSRMRHWVAAAIEAAVPLVQQKPETVLLCGMQPYAAGLVGLELQRRCGTPWVADLADPWTLDEVNSYSSLLHFKRQEACFRKVLRKASAVLANTPDSAAAMAEFEPSVSERMDIVTYGFDRSNLPAPAPAPPRDSETFTLLHLGAIEVTGASDRQRNPLRYKPYTTDIAARGTHYLLQALEQLRERRPELFARLRLRVVSSRTDNEFAAVRDRGMAEQFEWTGMLANERALAEVQRAHGALLLQQGAPAGHRLRTVRAKSYEYMALGKPVVACVPGGDGTDFIARYGRGIPCDPCDPDRIRAAIERLYDDYDQIVSAPVDEAFVGEFEWGSLTRRLDSVLTKLAPAVATN
ncbi:MAG: glycosyltransferase [Planctomycetota bacterium]